MASTIELLYRPLVRLARGALHVLRSNIVVGSHSMQEPLMVIATCLILFVAACAAWPRRWLVRDGQKYLLRFPLLGGDGLKRAPWFLGREGTNCYLHLIKMSDGPNVHSHPWDAKAMLLWGRYRDTRQYRTRFGWSASHVAEYGPGDINEIPGEAFHTLELLTPWVLTLCWTSPKHGKGWAFLVRGKVVNASGRGAAAYDEASKDA